MAVGTLETTVQKEVKKKKRLTVSGGGTGNNGRCGGGGGGGDNRKDDRPFDEIEEFRPNKLRVGMWFLLIVVLMTFGGLMGAYIVLATNKTLEWRPFALPGQIWVSTVLLLAGSVTFEISRIKLNQNKQDAAKKMLLATTVLGGVFIASQLVAWLQLANLGFFVEKHPYAGFFYILTVTHALHVLAGIIALGYILLRTWIPTANEEEILRRQTSTTVVSWFWHTLGGLWIVLIALLGLYK